MPPDVEILISIGSSRLVRWPWPIGHRPGPWPTPHVDGDDRTTLTTLRRSSRVRSTGRRFVRYRGHGHHLTISGQGFVQAVQPHGSAIVRKVRVVQVKLSSMACGKRCPTGYVLKYPKVACSPARGTANHITKRKPKQ